MSHCLPAALSPGAWAGLEGALSSRYIVLAGSDGVKGSSNLHAAVASCSRCLYCASSLSKVATCSFKSCCVCKRSEKACKGCGSQISLTKFIFDAIGRLDITLETGYRAEQRAVALTLMVDSASRLRFTMANINVFLTLSVPRVVIGSEMQLGPPDVSPRSFLGKLENFARQSVRVYLCRSWLIAMPQFSLIGHLRSICALLKEQSRRTRSSRRCLNRNVLFAVRAPKLDSTTCCCSLTCRCLARGVPMSA